MNKRHTRFTTRVRRFILSLVSLLALMTPRPLEAQEIQGIKQPGFEIQARCGDCLAVLRSKPKEVLFGLRVDERRDIWFVVNSDQFYDRLINRPTDGFAVDVVRRSLYACGSKPPVQSAFGRGELLPPVLLPELKKTKQSGPNGVAVRVGTLPAGLDPNDYELNLLVLKDRYLCHYNWFYNIASYRWDLLNMGMFMDTLTYAHSRGPGTGSTTSAILRRKTLEFTIPFKKNKSDWSANDLKPLYDSLRLTDHTIRSISIEAYSSVDGAEERNMELQQRRADSIVKALQSFQTPEITTTVKTSENWVEFLSDVAYTRHAHLAELPKVAIKERLQDAGVGADLEPMLARHRKAIVTLELQRKDPGTGLSDEATLRSFEQAINEKNLKRAQELQNTVFARMVDGELPLTFLDRMEVPAQKDHVGLLNSRVAFKYFQDAADALATYTALGELRRLAPNDAHVAYNLCAVKFRIWLLGDQVVEPLDFKREINALRTLGIEEKLVKRMLLNHNLVMAELHMAAGEYARKDECVKYVHQNYKSLSMSDADLLSLAQYLSSFANYDMAVGVVKSKAVMLDAPVDLLFYFLNLTIFDRDQTKGPDYRRILLNAINKDKRRFCALFTPPASGGVTFQLLDDPVLFSTYCETCQ